MVNTSNLLLKSTPLNHMTLLGLLAFKRILTLTLLYNGQAIDNTILVALQR
jgi:hypothetical protein